MALISLIHPSRGRAWKAAATADKWIKLAGCDVQHIFSIDLDDPDYSRYCMINLDVKSSCFIPGNNKSVVEATNIAATRANSDIILYLSDDFDCFPNWGQAVIKEFEGVTEPMLLKVHDNLQNFYARVLTIPIMNRALYEKLGYFFHPEYKSMWVDCDLFETCSIIGAIKNAPHLVFPHEHHSIGKADNDETYKRSEANWNQGLEIFNRRKKQRFPV